MRLLGAFNPSGLPVGKSVPTVLGLLVVVVDVVACSCGRAYSVLVFVHGRRRRRVTSLEYRRRFRDVCTGMFGALQ